MYRTLILLLTVVTISVTSSLTLGAADHLALSAVADLPLRSRLTDLAPAAQAKALATLNQLPGLLQEAEHLHVSIDGKMYLTNCATDDHPAHQAPPVGSAQGARAIVGRAAVPISSPTPIRLRCNPSR